eukprot:scaffold9778_cov72-Phaeocystis_antarctica.AAC.2
MLACGLLVWTAHPLPHKPEGSNARVAVSAGLLTETRAHVSRVKYPRGVSGIVDIFHPPRGVLGQYDLIRVFNKVSCQRALILGRWRTLETEVNSQHTFNTLILLYLLWNNSQVQRKQGVLWLFKIIMRKVF